MKAYFYKRLEKKGYLKNKNALYYYIHNETNKYEPIREYLLKKYNLSLNDFNFNLDKKYFLKLTYSEIYNLYINQ
jgi:hypothetical protein